MNGILFYFLVFGSAAILTAQENYLPGYILNYKGDTVKGKIKDCRHPTDPVKWQKIKFISNNGSKEKLNANNIKGYGFWSGPCYQTLVLGIDEKKYFVEIAERGAVILFIHKYIPSMAPNGNLPSSNMISVTFGDRQQYVITDNYLQKKNDVNSLMKWPGDNYKNTIKYFFRSDEEIVKMADENKDIRTIVKRYNEKTK